MSLLFTMIAVMPGAFAVHNDDFDLQGHVTTAAGGKVDWDDFLEGDGGTDGDVTEQETLPAGYLASGASPDHYRGAPDRTTFTQGSKDTLDINGGWTCTRSNNVGNKVDIINAYSAAKRNADGDLVIYFGVEIREPEGNSNIGMWFLKDESVGCEAPATGKAATAFSGQHTDGDVLVVSAFTNGGRTANISVYEWVGSGGSHGALDLAGDFVDVSCDTVPLTPDDVACAIANANDVTTPWHSPNKSNVSSALSPNTFFEGGVNISELLATENPADECFTQFLANTRSSQSLTATIFDFTIDKLAICGDLTIVKETDPEAYDQDFDFSISGPSIEAGVNDEFTLNASATDSKTYSNVLAGTYTITEEDIPDGWDLIDIECVNGTGEPLNTFTEGDDSVTIALGAEGSVTCTFTNRLRHSILLIKRDEAGDLLGGAAFEVDGPSGTLAMTEDPTGIHCVDNLIPGTYSVTETQTPTGYEPNTNIPDVTTSNTNTCADRIAALSDPPLDTEADVVVTNEPAPVDLTVLKKKLSIDDEGNSVETDTPLEFFEFSLYEGEDDTGTFVESATTDGTGTATFSSGVLEVGTQYTVCETGVPSGEEGYWTEPDCQTFTAALDTDVELTFYNGPKADVDITFTDVTGFTSITIKCVDSEGNTVVDETFTSTDTASLEKLDLGKYDCELDLRNGAVSSSN